MEVRYSLIDIGWIMKNIPQLVKSLSATANSSLIESNSISMLYGAIQSKNKSYGLQ